MNLRVYAVTADGKINITELFIDRCQKKDNIYRIKQGTSLYHKFLKAKKLKVKLNGHSYDITQEDVNKETIVIKYENSEGQEDEIMKYPLGNIICIPLKIFQSWHTLNLPPKMNDNVQLLKLQNPEFTHYLYDDEMCREFIKENFEEDVLNAYDKLIPGSYKCDLWRYCILYKYGGIYLDIKYKCVNDFKLIFLAFTFSPKLHAAKHVKADNIWHDFSFVTEVDGLKK